MVFDFIHLVGEIECDTQMRIGCRILHHRSQGIDRLLPVLILFSFTQIILQILDVTVDDIAAGLFRQILRRILQVDRVDLVLDESISRHLDLIIAAFSLGDGIVKKDHDDDRNKDHHGTDRPDAYRKRLLSVSFFHFFYLFRSASRSSCFFICLR